MCILLLLTENEVLHKKMVGNFNIILERGFLQGLAHNEVCTNTDESIVT